MKKPDVCIQLNEKEPFTDCIRRVCILTRIDFVNQDITTYCKRTRKRIWDGVMSLNRESDAIAVYQALADRINRLKSDPAQESSRLRISIEEFRKDILLADALLGSSDQRLREFAEREFQQKWIVEGMRVTTKAPNTGNSKNKTASGPKTATSDTSASTSIIAEREAGRNKTENQFIRRGYSAKIAFHPILMKADDYKDDLISNAYLSRVHEALHKFGCDFSRFVLFRMRAEYELCNLTEEERPYTTTFAPNKPSSVWPDSVCMARFVIGNKEARGAVGGPRHNPKACYINVYHALKAKQCCHITVDACTLMAASGEEDWIFGEMSEVKDFRVDDHTKMLDFSISHVPPSSQTAPPVSEKLEWENWAKLTINGVVQRGHSVTIAWRKERKTDTQSIP